MPAQLGVGNGQYTALSTAGTATLNPGPTPNSPPAGGVGVLYGMVQISAGTGFAATLVDVIAPTNIGTNTTTVTNTLLNGTGSAGQRFVAGLEGVGVRYKGSLLAITTGTPGSLNVLWD